MSPVHMAPDEAVKAHRDPGRRDQHRHPSRNFPTGGRGLDTPEKQLIASGPPESFLILKNGQFAEHSMTIDRHTLALISIVGSSLDVLGALYLAYDLLGGEHGPLRTLTRAITYGALFGPATASPWGRYSAWRPVWRTASRSPGSFPGLRGIGQSRDSGMTRR